MKLTHKAQRKILIVMALAISPMISFSVADAQNTITTVAGGGAVGGSAPSKINSDAFVPKAFLGKNGIAYNELKRPTEADSALKGPSHVRPMIGSNSNADIPGPSAVVSDGQGNTYVASPDAQQVYKIDASNTLTIFAGVGYSTESPTRFDGGAATSASLNEPTGLAIDSKGNVFIADMTDYLIRKVDANGVITTIAGNTTLCQDSTTLCGDGRKATNAELNYPTGITADASGNVYIADTENHRVRVVNLQSTAIVVAGIRINPGTINTIAGNGAPCVRPTNPCGDGGNARSANLKFPQGVAVDSQGNIFIADAGDHRIRVVSSNGLINAYAGNGTPCGNPVQGCGDGTPAVSASLNNPWQISVDSSDNLYVTDPIENRLRVVDAGTKTITTIAGTGVAGFNGNYENASSAQLNNSRGVWVDSTGAVTIGDTGNQMVRRISNGLIAAVVGGGNGGDNGPATSAILSASHDVALDSAGNLYIADTANNRIRMVTPGDQGNIYTIAGNGTAGFVGDNAPATLARLNQPFGIAIDQFNDIYIADTSNYAVRLVNQNSGIITTIAGNGHPCAKSTAACGDGGPATYAQFIRPTKVATDGAGNIYIADAGANKIRMINSSGVIMTFAGTGLACANPLAGNCGDDGPATQAELNGPFSVAVDGQGNIFIADTNDNRIRKVDSVTHLITAYAFDGRNAFGPEHVPALHSSYNTPQYINLDPRGNMYVSGSDFFYVVQRISAVDGTVMSVAGPAGDPKYYGFKGDGQNASKANLNNFGATIDGSGHLYIADGGNNRVRLVTLAAGASLTTTSMTFAPEPIGTEGSPQSLGMTNKGSDDLTFSEAPIVSGDYILTLIGGAGCAQNMIAPLGVCNAKVTFKPTGYGPRRGSITFSDNSYGHPTQKVFLSGSGPDFVMTQSTNTLSVVRGSQQTFTVTFSPLADFDQPILTTCGGVPKYSVCTASVNSVTLSGNSSTTVTYTIQVGAHTAPGTYTLRPTGTSVLKHETAIQLNVE